MSNQPWKTEVAGEMITLRNHVKESKLDFGLIMMLLEIDFIEANKLFLPNSISSNTEVYAKLFYHLNITAADPRTIPDRGLGRTVVIRKWRDERYQKWVSKQPKYNVVIQKIKNGRFNLEDMTTQIHLIKTNELLQKLVENPDESSSEIHAHLRKVQSLLGQLLLPNSSKANL